MVAVMENGHHYIPGLIKPKASWYPFSYFKDAMIKKCKKEKRKVCLKEIKKEWDEDKAGE